MGHSSHFTWVGFTQRCEYVLHIPRAVILIGSFTEIDCTLETDLPGAATGWSTGNGKKLSSSKAQLGPATCLLLHSFFPSCGRTRYMNPCSFERPIGIDEQPASQPTVRRAMRLGSDVRRHLYFVSFCPRSDPTSDSDRQDFRGFQASVRRDKQSGTINLATSCAEDRRPSSARCKYS